MTDFEEYPNWIQDFVGKIVQGGSGDAVQTLRAQVHTSTGHTETVKPEQTFLEEVKQFLDSDQNAPARTET